MEGAGKLYKNILCKWPDNAAFSKLVGVVVWTHPVFVSIDGIIIYEFPVAGLPGCDTLIDQWPQTMPAARLTMTLMVLRLTTTHFKATKGTERCRTIVEILAAFNTSVTTSFFFLYFTGKHPSGDLLFFPKEAVWVCLSIFPNWFLVKFRFLGINYYRFVLNTCEINWIPGKSSASAAVTHFISILMQSSSMLQSYPV